MTPEEQRVRWIEQHIGFAKLLLTLVVAALASIVSWLAQTSVEGKLLRLGEVGVAGLSLGAVVFFSWVLLMLRKLQQGKPNEPERLDYRREHRLRIDDIPDRGHHRVTHDPREMID